MAVAEQTLLAPAASEAAESLDSLVQSHARFVYRIAYAVLRNHHDAEDVTQETFVRVWRHRKELPEVRQARAWLARIAWRIAVSRRPKEATAVVEAGEAVASLQAPGRTAEEAAAANELMGLVGAAIRSLPAKLREAVELSLVSGLSSAEAAEVLGVPEGTVRTRVMRARQLLKEKLGPKLETRI